MRFGAKVSKTAVCLMAGILLIAFSYQAYGRNIYGKKASRKEKEAITYLASIATASICFFAEKSKWGNTFEEIGWSPEEGNRYAYFLNSCDEVIPASDGFKECPAELKKLFEDNPFDENKNFIAAAVRPKRKGAFNIWVVDQLKDPNRLAEFEPYKPQ